jgi:RNase adaptor protein for sRNA GlmZ degradation
MAERREKQRKFEQKATRRVKLKVNPNRELTIYTWGAQKRRQCPYKCERNFDASSIPYAHPNLKRITGMDREIQRDIFSKSRFKLYLIKIIETIEGSNLKRISINCHMGVHRSVALANILKRFYPKSSVYHIELKKKI